MEHLKLFSEVYRPRIFSSQEERDFCNFAARLERALNKFLGTPNTDYNKNKDKAFYTYVGAYFNAEPPHYPIYFSISAINTPEKQILKDYLDENNIKHFISYDFTMKQAEDLLFELKTNFVSKIANKYNI